MITVETPSRIIPLSYDAGDVVFHRLATERHRGLVTGIQIQPDGVSYWITWDDRHETRHYDCELSAEFVPDYESSE